MLNGLAEGAGTSVCSNTQMAGLLFALFSGLPSWYVELSRNVIDSMNRNATINYAYIISLLLAGRQASRAGPESVFSSHS